MAGAGGKPGGRGTGVTIALHVDQPRRRPARRHAERSLEGVRQQARALVLHLHLELFALVVEVACRQGGGCVPFEREGGKGALVPRPVPRGAAALLRGLLLPRGALRGLREAVPRQLARASAGAPRRSCLLTRTQRRRRPARHTRHERRAKGRAGVVGGRGAPWIDMLGLFWKRKKASCNTYSHARTARARARSLETATWYSSAVCGTARWRAIAARALPRGATRAALRFAFVDCLQSATWR